MPLILPKSAIAEIEEKRSKFIAHCKPAETEAAAKEFIGEIRARHRQANHNVYAYIISAGNISRYSDDGEPHGTAGMPVYNVFYKTGVVDFVCVVTRYFGGTLLGAGGLVRAYSGAAKTAMLAAEPIERIIYSAFYVLLPYPALDSCKYKLGKLGVKILDIEYTSECKLTVSVREDLEEAFRATVSRYTVIPASAIPAPAP